MEQNVDDTPILVGQAGPLSGQRWMVRGEIVIGRDEDCEIMIPSRQVSRHHALFKASKAGVILEDLNSKNGTHLNGSPISEPVQLNDGDLVQIAFAQQFVFLSSDATLPLEIGEELITHVVLHGRLRLERRTRQVWIGNEEVDPPLSASQFQLLEMLYDNESQVLPRREIIARIWGAENALEVSEQALDALVRRLRDRLSTIDPDHQFIVTLRGHGLRLNNPP
jgi:pSer/pThr/pTyr-binding forkhead associated (FHA) protein